MAFLPTPPALSRRPCAWSRRPARSIAHRKPPTPAAPPPPRACAPPPNPPPAEPPSNSLTDGAVLPEVHPRVLDAQSAWLETTLRHWLDGEFRTADAHTAHRAIARQTSLLYRRLRAEGVHDLTTVVLELGGGLEGADSFSEAFVGPWNIANKAGELLMQNVDATAPRDVDRSFDTASTSSPSSPADAEATGLRAVPPGLADDFEKYRFMQLVLDGEVSSARVNGAVAEAMGFAYDAASATWSGAKVTDAHFCALGDTPADVLGDEDAAAWTDTLRYMERQLGLGEDEDEDGRKAEGFQTLLETLNGVELTRSRQADAGDHAFAKRSAVVKWLHMIADYC